MFVEDIHEGDRLILDLKKAHELNSGVESWIWDYANDTLFSLEVPVIVTDVEDEDYDGPYDVRIEVEEDRSLGDWVSHDILKECQDTVFSKSAELDSLFE